MKFTEQQLKELAVEPSWLKLYSNTTGRMVKPFKTSKLSVLAFKKKSKVNDEGSGIVFKDELTAMGKEK